MSANFIPMHSSTSNSEQPRDLDYDKFDQRLRKSAGATTTAAKPKPSEDVWMNSESVDFGSCCNAVKSGSVVTTGNIEEWDDGRPVYMPIFHERTRSFHEENRYPEGLQAMEPEQRRLGDQELAEVIANTPRAEEDLWYREFQGAEAWPIPYNTKPHFHHSNSERALRCQDGSPSMQTSPLINEPWSSPHIKNVSDLQNYTQSRRTGRNLEKASSTDHHKSQVFLDNIGEGTSAVAYPGISASDSTTRTIMASRDVAKFMLEKAEMRTNRQHELTPERYWITTEQLPSMIGTDLEIRNMKDRTGNATSDAAFGVHTVKGDRIVRAGGGKDRHSKVRTSKGPRDRRVRLSVSTAIQFYDIQDRLGYDQPSKAVDWLMKNAKAAIDELPRHPNNIPQFPGPDACKSSLLIKTSRKGEVAVYSATSDIASDPCCLSAAAQDQSERQLNSRRFVSVEPKEVQIQGVEEEQGCMKPAERSASTSSGASDGSRELESAGMTCGSGRWVNQRKRARERTVEKYDGRDKGNC